MWVNKEEENRQPVTKIKSADVARQERAARYEVTLESWRRTCNEAIDSLIADNTPTFRLSQRLPGDIRFELLDAGYTLNNVGNDRDGMEIEVTM